MGFFWGCGDGWGVKGLNGGRKWGRGRAGVGDGGGGDFEPEVGVEWTGCGEGEGGDFKPEVGEGKAGCGERRSGERRGG